MHKNLAKQLNAAYDDISSALHVCGTEKKTSILKDTLTRTSETINTTVTALANSSHSRALSKTRKSLVAIENTIGSLRDGLAGRDISLKDFRAVCSNLQAKFLPKFVECLGNEVQSLPEDAVVPENKDISTVEYVEAPTKTAVDPRVQTVLSSGGRSIQEQMAAIKAMLDDHKARRANEVKPSVDEEDDEEETEEERAERLEHERELDRLRREGEADISSIETLSILRRKRSLLPQRMTKLQPFMVVKLPLIPVFSDTPFIIEGKGSKFERILNQLGIKFSVIQGYAALEEQLVLCVSRTDIEQASLSHKDSVRKEQRVKVKQKKNSLKTSDANIEKMEQQRAEYLKEEAKLTKQYAVFKTADDARLRERRKLMDEVKKLSPETWDHLFHRDTTRRMEYSDLNESDSKRRQRIRNAVADDLPMPSMKGKSDDEQFLLKEAYETDLANLLLSRSRQHRNSLGVRDKNKVKKLIEELNDLSKELKKGITMQQAINDAKQKAANVSKQIEALETRRYDAEESIKDVRKQHQARLDDITPAQYATSVLAHINELSHSSYQLVTNEFKTNVRNSDILCFWIMPAAKLSVFMRLGSAKTKVQWAFPWDE